MPFNFASYNKAVQRHENHINSIRSSVRDLEYKRRIINGLIGEGFVNTDEPLKKLDQQIAEREQEICEINEKLHLLYLIHDLTTTEEDRPK